MAAPMPGARSHVPLAVLRLVLPLAPAAFAAQALADGSPTSPPAPAASASASTPAPAPPAPRPATPAPPPPAPPPAPPAPAKKWDLSYTLNGYVEAAYSYSFEKPSNGIIDERGFDNRHNTFTISNAVVDVAGKFGSLSARVALQVGQTPDTYYLSEPTLPGTASTPGSSASAWKYIQQAYAGWKAPVARGLALEAGIFLSPIGFEVMAVKDNWNWSRSNLFFALPFYHTGLRATLEATEHTSIVAMLVNGWNSVVDNNPGKSILTELLYTVPDHVAATLLYMGGPERPSNAPEGQPWRHLLDGTVQATPIPVLSVGTEWSAGMERNRFGTSYWGAIALYARVQPVSWLYLAARVDRLSEHRGSGPDGTASPIFFPAPWVSSGTFTVEARPIADHLSIRLEYRHDQAGSDLYFSGAVKGNGTSEPYVPNAEAQNTITAGATAWF
jgi:hypothetical protein